MNCEEIKTLSISYIQNELDANQIEQVNSHLANCKSCSAFFTFSSLSIQQINNEKKTELDPFYFSSLMAKMENQQSSTQKRFAPIRILQTSALVAAMFIAVLGGSFIGTYSAEAFNTDAAVMENADDNIIASDFTNNDFDLFNDL
jgi:anti-sigma factor RsiW